ncbi:hypothetical protein D3C72_703170 [compost metagenome]
MRASSPIQVRARPGAISRPIVNPLAAAAGSKRRVTPSSIGRRAKGRASIVSLPASILERSSMSLSRTRSASPDSTSRRLCSFSRGGRSAWDRARAMPITPLRGVRISWLILAMKSLLARLAASARRRAATAVASAVRRWARAADRPRTAATVAAASSRPATRSCRAGRGWSYRMRMKTGRAASAHR